MKKRTHIDFTKHEVIVSESENAIIHHLKLPNTMTNSIKYINAGGILAVTGDFGNWIFCREFHVGEKNSVSDQYWEEKLQIASVQEALQFSSDETVKAIDEAIHSGEHSLEDIDYLRELRDRADTTNGIEYQAWAYENCPFDPEYIPYRTETHFWLRCVFDGFDEMCERLKIKEVVEN